VRFGGRVYTYTARVGGSDGQPVQTPLNGHVATAASPSGWTCSTECHGSTAARRRVDKI